MKSDKWKAECQSLKVRIIVWIALAIFLTIHTHSWVPTTPFLTTFLFWVWSAFAVIMGIFFGASDWDLVTTKRRLKSFRQTVRYAAGFILYVLIVLAFYASVFLGMIFSFEAVLGSLNANGDTNPVTIHPWISEGANRYLLLFIFVIAAIVQTFAISKPLARWFNTNMECWLNLPKPSTPEARYFRTRIRKGGRVEVVSPELEAGQTVEVVVRPIKRRTGREG